MQSFLYQVDSKCPRQFVNCKMNMCQSNWSPITFYSHCSGKTTQRGKNRKTTQIDQSNNNKEIGKQNMQPSFTKQVLLS